VLARNTRCPGRPRDPRLCRRDQRQSGQWAHLTVFAAAVIGGISLGGGKGTMFGAPTGVLLLGVVGNLLTLAQVPSFWIQAIYGAIILGPLMVARFAGGQSRSRPQLRA
jgi:ribose/xylose/arabinose/galactoside ABC-type transport system permease subunit